MRSCKRGCTLCERQAIGRAIGTDKGRFAGRAGGVISGLDLRAINTEESGSEEIYPWRRASTAADA